MKIQRRLPPASAPLLWNNLWYGLAGLVERRRYLQKLEEDLKKYFDVRYVFLVSSGKAALTVILSALKSISARNEVVIPAYTCFSVPSAIVRAGLNITLCDIDASTLDFNYQSLEMRFNANTLCVIPHHLFGAPADMHTLLRLCRERDVFVIEDAAQAMGGTYGGRKLGTLGDVGFFSLGRGKNVTCGAGGIIVTNSKQIAEAVEHRIATLEQPGFFESVKEWFILLLMTIFIRPSLYWFPDGLAFLKLGATPFHKTFPLKRLSGMKAGYLHNWKSCLEQANHTRATCASYYRERLQLSRAVTTSIPYLRLPIMLRNAETRDDVYLLSRRLGLGAGIVYPTTINKIKEIRLMFDGEDYPCADNVAERILTIPTHHLLSDTDKEAICALINAVTNQDASPAPHDRATYPVTTAPQS